MKLSARNQIRGRVVSVDDGMVNSKVKVKLEAPADVTSVITKESVADLGIKPGDEVIIVIKSSDVMLAKD